MSEQTVSDISEIVSEASKKHFTSLAEAIDSICKEIGVTKENAHNFRILVEESKDPNTKTYFFQKVDEAGEGYSIKFPRNSKENASSRSERFWPD